MRKRVITIILSLIYTIFMAVGTSFIKSNSFKYLKDNLIIMIILSLLLFIILYFILNKVFDYLDDYKKKEDKTKNRILNLFDKHPIIFSSIVMFACYIIYMIAFYPIIMSKDPSFQLLQYFHIDNKYSYYSVLLDKNVIITNHHPVIHTLLLGTCVKLGMVLFNSSNVGLFIYSIIQTSILILTLSYTIKFMKEINISIKYRFACLLIYALVPVFPFYAMSPVKDVIFGCLIILYIITVYKCIKLEEKISIKNIIKIIILSILMFLFRNNGIHVFILTFPFLILINKKNRKSFLIIFLVVVSLFVTYSKVILPYFKITPSSVRETLSIPFQQTARYVKEHENEVTNDEKKAIDKILGYDTLKDRYKEEIADPVKNEFNKYSTKEDLKNYFVVWFEMFKKYPLTYVEATINNTYGYFYPFSTKWYIYYKYTPIIKEHGIDYHYNNLTNLRTNLSNYGNIFPYIPIIGLIVNIGFSNYILIFMLFYLIYKKKYKEMCYLFPSFVLTLVCIASPVNTYFRYALPTIFAMPVMISMFFKTIRNGK